jgi:NitT/TauT family transport system substrate-binding protein
MMVGGSARAGETPIWLASELGYYSGVNLKLTEYGSAAEVVQAFRDGKLQVAAVTLGEAMQLRRVIPDLKIVLLLDSSNGADAILAQSNITDLHQLQGHRVGADEAGLYFLDLALRSANMQMQQLQIVPLSADAQEAAFREHKVDAVVASEPVKARLLAAGAQTLFGSGRAPNKLFDVLITRDDNIGRYHREMVGLAQGWRRALDYFSTEPGKAMQIMAKRAHLDPTAFAGTLSGIALIDWPQNRQLLRGDPPPIAPAIEEIQRFMLSRGALQIGGDAATLVEPALLSEKDAGNSTAP